jgi:hypothetical protein
MTNNLGRTEVSVNQTAKETAINNSDGRIDAAITAQFEAIWSGAETLKTATTAETQQHVAFRFSGSTSGSPSFKFGNIQRGMVIVRNDMGVTVPVTDYAGTDSYNALAGTTTVLYVTADALKVIVTSNSIPEAANDGLRYVRQSLGWSDNGGLVTTETGTTDTLAVGDADDTIIYTNAGAVTVTIPLNATAAIRIGSFITLVQGPAGGVVTASPTGGVTLNGATATGGVNTSLTLFKAGTDTWYGFAASGVADAANDGVIYARQSATWKDIGNKVNTTSSLTPTLAIGDAYDTITLTGTGAVAISLPQNSDVGYTVGTEIQFIQGVNATSVTLSAGAGATVRGTKLVTSRPGERLIAKKTDTNTWYVFQADTGGLYNVSGYFVTVPTASEVLLNHIFSETVYFPDNFAGAVAHIETNPTASFVIDVQKNGSSIGSLTVSTGGAMTFATTGSGEETFNSGDRLRLLAPGTPDATAANMTWTFKGRK